MGLPSLLLSCSVSKLALTWHLLIFPLSIILALPSLRLLGRNEHQITPAIAAGALMVETIFLLQHLAVGLLVPLLYLCFLSLLLLRGRCGAWVRTSLEKGKVTA